MSEQERDSSDIAPTARIYPNVSLGRNVVVDDYCIIGYPPSGCEPGELDTIIGDHTRIRSHSIIYAGTTIGARCQVGHSSFIREMTRIGDDCSVGLNVVIEHHCVIGSNVRIQGQAGLAEHTVVEDDAWIGPRVLTTNVLHPTCASAKQCLAGPTIRKGAIIGANAVISPDVEVGANSFIGATSVIVKAVEDRAIMFGVPARKIGTVDKINCPYDLVGGNGPYARSTEAVALQPIPLVDLAAQHQEHKQDIRLALDRVILNTRFIRGKEVGEFETAFAKFCRAEDAIGVNSGTDALYLALRALGIGSGDEVITTTHTFVATASAIIQAGARPVLVDVDPQSFCIDPDQIEAKITSRTKAILPVHLYGHPADMEAIATVARRRGLAIIEDAAQAHGAECAQRRIGTWGDIACFSFFPSKNLGAYGDAGAVVTNTKALAEKVGKLRDAGRSEKYLSDIVGTNSRLDTLQAAVLGVKLRYLENWNEARRKVAALYTEKLSGLPLKLPTERANSRHVYHLYVIRTPRRDALAKHLAKYKIGTGIHYPVPLHLQPALSFLGYGKGEFPRTETIADEILSLPMYPELSTAQIDRVADAIREFFSDS
jgi:dTDP-4-amino-4,6-dideoxygalactose transaminase/acetyltransferase-like isoleucine patch superfamily enzyme